MTKEEIEEKMGQYDLVYNRTRSYLVPHFLTEYNVKIYTRSPKAWFIYHEGSSTQFGLIALFDAKGQFKELEKIRQNKLYIKDETLWFDNIHSFFHLFYFVFPNHKAMYYFLNSKYSLMYNPDEIQRAYSDSRLNRLSKESRSLQLMARNTLLKDDKRRLIFEEEVNSLSKTDDYKTRIIIPHDVEYDFPIVLEEEIITKDKKVSSETLKKIMEYEKLHSNYSTNMYVS